jgi:hypothetical protein
LQWVERAVPDLASEAEQWMRDHLDTNAVSTPRFDDYAALIDRLDQVASSHEVYLAAQVQSRSADLDESLEVAVSEWSAISRRLASIGLSPKPLSRAELTGLLKAYTDGIGFAGAEAATDTMPMAVDEQWDHTRIDGLYHRAFAVTAWPRVRVWPSWLEPLLLGASSGSLRTLSVHMHPIAQDTARRRAQAAVAATALDEDSRRRAGFLASAQHRREAGDAAHREEELVAGYGEHAIGAVCLVSAPTLDLIDSGSRALVQGAVQSSLDLRVLYGAQQAGYVAALPLAALRFARTVV